jgi:hypothetical protein
MNSNITLKEQRLQELFADCQQQVISQIIGPFGLSTAMFEDRSGGNVTTYHNFERETDDYIAETDKINYKKSREAYDREDYESSEFSKKSKVLRNAGIDGYTGKNAAPDKMDLDHVTSLKSISEKKITHLALETGRGLNKVKQMANSDKNLVTTLNSTNRSKGSDALDDFCDRKGAELGLNRELVKDAQTRSTTHINTTVNVALLKKQSKELLVTGGKQSLQMGVRQALGVLLTELVNGLFHEFKLLIKHGVEDGKTLFEEIRQRFMRVIESVIKKIPDAVSQMFEGGISGFMSNLLTFLLNSFLSTAKRFVTAIRAGLLGLFKAFKMIFFPPKHMTAQEALQAGLKLLTTVVVSTVGILIGESVANFMKAIPFADMIAPVLVGIITGLLSAFLAYQIDCLFDRFINSNNERLMDDLIANTERQDEFANELVKLSESSLQNVSNYANSIYLYQSIGESLGSAGNAASATLRSLESIVSETRDQVCKSAIMIDYIKSSQIDVENFLKTI